MASTEPGRYCCCVLSGNRSERSEIQSLAASSAVQMTSPSITSRSSPPAWNWVLSLSRRCPVSALPCWKMTSYLSLFLSLNWLTSLAVVPDVSGGPVKYSSVAPPLCSPPPQPAAPRSAAPASPAPPTLRKSPRESPLSLDLLCSIRLTSSLADQPLVVGIVLYLPFAYRSCHHVEVVEVVARGRRDYVVALRYEHHITVVERKRLVERAVFGIDPLQREALLGLDSMVVRLLQVPLARGVFRVVLVGRIAGPVAVRGDDLDHKKPFGRLVLHEDVGDHALHVASTAGAPLGVFLSDQARRGTLFGRSGANGQLQVGYCLHPVARARRQVDRVRRPLEDAVAAAYAPPLLLRGGHSAESGEDDEAHLLPASVALDDSSIREPQHLEADVLPTGGLRRNPHNAAVGIRPRIGAHYKPRHALNPSLKPDASLTGTCVLPSCSRHTLCGRRSQTPSQRPRRRARPRRSRSRGRPRSGPRGCR